MASCKVAYVAGAGRLTKRASSLHMASQLESMVKDLFGGATVATASGRWELPGWMPGILAGSRTVNRARSQ
jgi:hypothetical protein